MRRRQAAHPLPVALHISISKQARGDIVARRRLPRQSLSVEHLLVDGRQQLPKFNWVMIISINYSD